MNEHIIKKYPNRRLYDTETSKYIKLTDLKDMIVAGACIKVIDSNTEEDLTRSILMQIITESENGGQPMFSSAMLQQIIRFYGSTLQGMFAQYLEESLQLFARQQNEMRDAFGNDSITTMTKLAEQNMKMWTDFQSSFFRGMTPPKDKE